MAATYPLRIVTHEAIVFDGDVESLVSPGVMGYLGVLAHHAPLLTNLTQGTVTIRDAQEAVHEFQVDGGILEVSKHDTTILTETIEKADPS